MAGWILYNKGLDKRPQIVRTMSACSLDRWRAVGAWLTLWEWADDVTEDGFVPHVTPADVDTIVGVPGFFAVGVEVGWLSQVTGGIRLVDFTEYNTDSAKKRAKDAKRKARVRNVSADSRTERGQMSESSRTNRGATEHNRTEKPPPTPQGAKAGGGDSPSLREIQKAWPAMPTPTAREVADLGLTSDELNELDQAADAIKPPLRDKSAWLLVNARKYAERKRKPPPVHGGGSAGPVADRTVASASGGAA